jgi:hypothetical protein
LERAPDEDHVEAFGGFFLVWGGGGFGDVGGGEREGAFHAGHGFGGGALLLAFGEVRGHVGGGVFPALLALHVAPGEPVGVFPLDLSQWASHG